MSTTAHTSPTLASIAAASAVSYAPSKRCATDGRGSAPHRDAVALAIVATLPADMGSQDAARLALAVANAPTVQADGWVRVGNDARTSDDARRKPWAYNEAAGAANVAMGIDALAMARLARRTSARPGDLIPMIVRLASLPNDVPALSAIAADDGGFPRMLRSAARARMTTDAVQDVEAAIAEDAKPVQEAAPQDEPTKPAKRGKGKGKGTK